MMHTFFIAKFYTFQASIALLSIVYKKMLDAALETLKSLVIQHQERLLASNSSISTVF
jgi:hypothetical protein